MLLFSVSDLECSLDYVVARHDWLERNQFDCW